MGKPSELPSCNSMDSDSVAVWSQRGRTHVNLEDRYKVIESLAIADFSLEPFSFYGIFDGHNGINCSECLTDNLYTKIALSPSFKNGDFHHALKEGFLEMDKHFIEIAAKNGLKDGSCALVCIWARHLNKLLIGNAGDSRIVLCRKGRAIPLSYDHRPTSEREVERIIRQGGTVPQNGRLHNMFAISRALGDRDFKSEKLGGLLTAEPDTLEVDITPDDYFLIMATDGFWDVISNDEAVTLTVQLFSKYSVYSLGRVSKELVKEAQNRGSNDDVTVLVLLLKKPAPR